MQSHSIVMKICVKNVLQPAHFLAFVSGFCPYRKFANDPYRRSTLGTVLQLANVILTMNVQVYIAGYYLPEAIGERDQCSSRMTWSLWIIQLINISFSLWLTVDRCILTSKTLRCLQVADDLAETICQISSMKQLPIAFYFAMVWTIVYLIKVPGRQVIDFMGITSFVTQFLTLYCETLVLEFVTVICIALETINRTLKNWETSESGDINALNRLQSLHLKAAYLAEVVNDAFGISLLVSILTKSIRIVLVSYWILKLLSDAIDSGDDKVSTGGNITYVYLTLSLAAGMLHCFYVCHYFHQPSVKRMKMVGILCGLISQNRDPVMSIKMNEFSLQVALRKMEFTGGGFCDINLRYFVEIVGTWFTLLVILLQITKA